MQIAGFKLHDVIQAFGDTAVCSAETAQGERVVLKVLDNEQPSLELLARWRHEFAVLQSIQSPWVIRAKALVPVERRLVLVLEPFGPYNLAQLIERRLLDLRERLTLALQLVQALSDVHAAHLVHGDIAPKNILVDLAALQLKLCDFGLASRLDQEQRRSTDAYLRGTLAYMAPEQTGRTNLDVDYRSDFYSLGATLYELFSGSCPFPDSDPMALLHAHLAVVPRLLHEAAPEVPPAVSAVVHKLLAKYPGDRYQSSFGVKHDLARCLHELDAQGRIQPFPVAQHDLPERFCLSQRLYGREAQVNAIWAAFEWCSAGQPQLLLVGGQSGIGKTALVGELHRPIVARRGYFLRGKCAQFSQGAPYAALVEAFQPLVRQLAVEGDERRRYWTERLHAALGEQAGAVAEIVPNLGELMGALPPLPQLPAAEREQRFHIAFGHFVQALAGPAHPLMLFIDDLQWADAATLRLLEQLVEADSGACLLVVGAYRNNEVDDTHPLTQTLQAITRSQGRLETLHLDNLNGDQVCALVADTLHQAPHAVAPLAALCTEKTAGNPFFLGQFLRRLVTHGDLRYDRATGAWGWNIAQIRQREMTDNVVTLMLERLHTLPEATQALLARAALLGDSFSLHELQRLAGRSGEALHPLTDVASQLWPALQSGLLLPLDEAYKFEASPEPLAAARYRFLHDRVTQAAHALTDAADRPALQLHCGRRLRDGLSPAERETRLFDVLGCLNPAVALITDPAERAGLMALNQLAGLRAKAASAHAPAVALLRQARALQQPDAWQQQPQQALHLLRELAEAEYLAGHFERAEALYAEGQAACTEALGQVSLWLVQVDQLHIQGRFADALPVLLQALARLGTPFPDTEAEAGAAFPAEFAQTQALLARAPLNNLLQAPEMRDAAHQAEMRLYHALSYASYQTGRFGAFVVGACRMVRTTLEHGQGDLSCVAYVAYMTAMSAMKTPYPQCHAMGRLALTLAEQRDNRYFRLTVYQYFGPFYQHWCEPLADTLPLLERGLAMGENGINPLSAGFCALLRSVNRLALGTPLDELALECERGLKFLTRSHQTATAAMLRHGVLQPVRALLGQTLGPLSFDSSDNRSSEFFAGDYSSPSIPLALHSAAALRHAYLMDDAPLWRLHAGNLATIGMCLPDSPSSVEAQFYVALGRLREGYDTGADATAQAQAQADLLATWAEGCPSNFLHKQLLLQAELARVRGDDKAAMALYAEAIDAAGEAGFTACEALANELYARFWLAQQQRQLAANFVREAYFHYRRWGAQTKCRQLEAQWPQLSFRLARQRGVVPAGQSMDLGLSLSQSSLLSDSSNTNGLPDLHALLKAHQALAQQIHLDQLLAQMLHVLLETAGAQGGAIVRADGAHLVVECIGQMVPGPTLRHQRLHQRLSDSAELLPVSLIEYTRLTRSALVLNQPAQDNRFAHSVYLQQRQPKSTLCLPVTAQGQLVALVYLENNQLEDAFTLRHQQTLALLSAQAAISLVNARLYESLEEKVAQRTEELRQMSMKDGLTGIANRRAFDERLALEWRRSLRDGQPLSLLMVDIDHFKQYNDHHGHLEGDRCIQAVAGTLVQAAARAADLVARYGGEEFALLLPATDTEAATEVAQACLAALAQRALPHPGTGGLVSLSVGVATVNVGPGDLNPQALIERADQALYRAKRGGRNRLAA
jgi:diguanylate cyclase (GGDEF)-like protein